MYRVNNHTIRRIVLPYLRSFEHGADTHIQRVIRKDYSLSYNYGGDPYKLHSDITKLGTLSQYLGIWDRTHALGTYTNSLVELWKKGFITRSYVHVCELQATTVESLFQTNEVGDVPGQMMIKQILLTKSRVPVSFLFHMAVHITPELLKSFEFADVSTNDRSLYRNIVNIPINRGIMGPTGATGPMGARGFVPDPRKYLQGSKIPYIQSKYRYWPNYYQMNLDAARDLIERMKSDPKYDNIMSRLDGGDDVMMF